MADPGNPRCSCASCRMRGLMGPLMLITVGLIFLIGEYSRFDFGYLWPLLLIVPGIIMVAQALASKQGHIER
ncbi:MAG TPA: DUF5668 domain-containing protein [Verrucomicrobiae bacterium]|nr:DUF5668 domain-containing protein [Verrucomicrobiae bacterium]